MRIPVEAGDAVLSAVRRIGQTEDIQFSPSGRRLALAGIHTNRLLILEVDVDASGDAPRVEISGGFEVSSPALGHPHGVSWLGDDTVFVANRDMAVAVFELPTRGSASGCVTVQPVRTIGDDRRDVVKTPGSVSVFPIGLGLVELLVCNNHTDHVSRHLVDPRDGYAVRASESLISDGLRVPDGITHSPCGRLIAVSNHFAHSVWIYRNDDSLHEASAPHGVLRNAGFPHGLSFTPDGKWMLVADSGAPLVHAYRSEDGTWEGEREPAASVEIMSDATFERGRLYPWEGGPKGLDLSPDGTLLAATCKEDRLVFFDMRPTLGNVAAVPDRSECNAEAEQARQYLLRYLDAARSRVDEATEAIRRTSEREVQLLLTSRWWRVTAPFRRMSASVQYAARHARHRLKRASAIQ